MRHTAGPPGPRAGPRRTHPLVNPHPAFVERIRLHQAAAGQRLRQRRIGDLLRPAGVELVTGCARCVDLDHRTVDVDGRTLGWDRLVLALGSRAAPRDVPGAAEHAWTMDPGRVPGLLERLRDLRPAPVSPWSAVA